MKKQLWLRTIVSGEPKDVLEYINFQDKTGFFNDGEFDELIKNKTISNDKFNIKIILNGTVYIFENRIPEELQVDFMDITEVKHPRASNESIIENERVFITSYFFERIE